MQWDMTHCRTFNEEIRIMRQDMYKVIVERPRSGGCNRSDLREPDDLEDSPRQEGLRRRHRSRKWLNENLRPLERFLASQVGRPWDKVYSEICAGIDRRNTVQQHIHQHLEDFVAIKVIEIDGTMHHVRRHWKPQPLNSTSVGYGSAPKFYVDPGTDLLLVNRWRNEARRNLRDQRRIAHAERHGGLRDGLRILDATQQLHRIEGVWYRVEVAPVRTASEPVTVDAIRKIPVDQCPDHNDSKKIASNLTLFGHADLYARSKRQLNARELRHYRLSNDNASHQSSR
jgi:hypothetical protein